eukprot:4920903-Pyramimonas_sp.AAC.1
MAAMHDGRPGIAGVARPRHQRGCAGGGGPMRFGPAMRGRRGTSSTPEGVRWGLGPYALRARRAWQAWHFLDTRG